MKPVAALKEADQSKGWLDGWTDVRMEGWMSGRMLQISRQRLEMSWPVSVCVRALWSVSALNKKPSFSQLAQFTSDQI